MSWLLLKGGTVLVHDGNDNITPTLADVLVQGDKIARIEPSISTPKDCEVIDCAEKIVSPGFIDTHHHVWQSPLKGLVGNKTFLQYHAVAHTASLELAPNDLFWANLAGSMEAMDAGTTTTLDHAHMNWSRDHSKAAVAGTMTSGIRSIFAYSPVPVLQSTKPTVKFAPDPLPDWVMGSFEQLATSSPLKDPNCRVQMGFGFDFYFLPKQVVQSVFSRVRALGAKVITSHFVRQLSGGDSESLVAKLKSYGLLGRDMVLSHAGGATPEDVNLLAEAGCFISTTPSTEQAMAVGPPVAFRDDLPGMDKLCSLGIDCHCATSSSLVGEMRLALQGARGLNSTTQLRSGRFPTRIFHTTTEAFNLGTIQGARALGMERDIGSIAVGKKADLIVMNSLSPAMSGAAHQDPVMAIVLHSGVGDIDTVVVDGKVRKRHGQLLPTKLMEWLREDSLMETERTISWQEVLQKILEMQRRLVSKLPDSNISGIESHLREIYQLDS